MSAAVSVVGAKLELIDLAIASFKSGSQAGRVVALLFPFIPFLICCSISYALLDSSPVPFSLP